MRIVPIGAQGSFAMIVSPEHLANRFKDATLPAICRLLRSSGSFASKGAL